MTQNELDILTNIIGAVESGGQVYGKRDYSIYAGAYSTTTTEVTCTLGWACFYGYSAKSLIQMIFDADTAGFRAIDVNGLIEAKLSSDWVKEKWNPSDEEASVLKQLIVTDVGKQCQDLLFQKGMQTFIDKAIAYDSTMSVQAQIMWCEIAHLGGVNCCINRIFPRATTPYTPESIFDSLMQDQDDLTNNNQVGDKLYQSRHERCVEWINTYLPSTSVEIPVEDDEEPIQEVVEEQTEEEPIQIEEEQTQEEEQIPDGIYILTDDEETKAKSLIQLIVELIWKIIKVFKGE